MAVIIDMNAAREAIRDTRSSVSKKLPTASAMADKVYDTDAGQEYLDECLGAMLEMAEENPSILEDVVTDSMDIIHCVNMIDPETLRETIRATLEMNAATTLDDLKQMLIEAGNYLANATPEEVDGFSRQMKESMRAVGGLWVEYNQLFGELIAEMEPETREALVSTSAEISAYIADGGLKGTVLEDYATILYDTWKWTHDLAASVNA